MLCQYYIPLCFLSYMKSSNHVHIPCAFLLFCTTCKSRLVLWITSFTRGFLNQNLFFSYSSSPEGLNPDPEAIEIWAQTIFPAFSSSSPFHALPTHSALFQSLLLKPHACISSSPVLTCFSHLKSVPQETWSLPFFKGQNTLLMLISFVFQVSEYSPHAYFFLPWTSQHPQPCLVHLSLAFSACYCYICVWMRQTSPGHPLGMKLSFTAIPCPNCSSHFR